jgi:uncharacterized delta-60 repeat protein
MKKIFLLFICLLFSQIAITYGQVNQEWLANYNGTGAGTYHAIAIALGKGGNVYIAGSSNINSKSFYTTIKYNASGEQQWVEVYDSPAQLIDQVEALAVDGKENVYVTGMSDGIGTGKDIATVKYNSSGVQQWAVRYNGPNNSNDEASALATDAHGNVYVTGYSTGSGTGKDFTTIKYDAAGVEQWVQRYNGPANNEDYATSIALDAQDNVLVTGYSMGISSYSDCATIKYSSSGIQQWISRYNGPANSYDYAKSLGVDNQGNVIITGYTQTSGVDFDFVTVKYNSSGVQQWAQLYHGPDNFMDVGQKIAVDAEGNIYVTGFSNGFLTKNDFATVKYNPTGVQQWAARYNGPGNKDDSPNSITVDNIGNVYVTGLSYTNETTIYDYATIKYNSNGIQQWETRFSGPGNGQDEANAIAVDGQFNVYVTGSLNENGTNASFETIKYSQPIGIKKISDKIPAQFNISQNFPNPFNPSTTIKLDIASSSTVKLIIYDILGEEVQILVNEELNPGDYELKWQPNGLSGGIYFAKLITPYFTSTIKMILSK